MMWLIGKKLKKRHQLKPDVRQSLYDEVNFWLKAIKTNQTPFMGGQSPDCSDLAVYGVLSAIEGIFIDKLVGFPCKEKNVFFSD